MSQKENTRFIQTRWPYSRTGTFQPLQIQEDLKWKEHINNVTKKASSTLGFLRRNLQHCPRECRKNSLHGTDPVNNGIRSYHLGPV